MWREEPVPHRLRQLGVERSIAVEDPWPANLCWRLLLSDGRVVVCPVTIRQLKELGEYGLIALCAQAVARELARRPLPRAAHPPAAPDLVQTVVAFRAWKLGKDWQLGPIGAGKAGWDGAREVEAECASSHHASPDPACHCGWNAWHDAGMVERQLQGDRFLVGAIACRGRVEVHHDGVRAQYARPICLAYREGETSQLRLLGDRTPTHEDRVRYVARRLGLAAVPISRLEAYALERGAPVPPEMRPAEPVGPMKLTTTFAAGGIIPSAASSVTLTQTFTLP